MTDVSQIAKSCVCYNLRKTARAVTQLFNDALRPSGLTATQFNLLVALSLAGETTLSRLSEVLVMERTTLTRNLSRLEASDIIESRRGKDRRERWLRLTEKGSAVLGAAIPYWELAQSRIVKAMGDERIASMVAELRSTVRSL